MFRIPEQLHKDNTGVTEVKQNHKWMVFSVTVVMGMLFVIWAGSRTVTVLSEQLPIKRSCCIILDAGHGGIDGGTTSCTGVLESNLNLEITLRLNDLLQFLGRETYMIRTTDTSVHTQGKTIAQIKVSDLKERVRIVNNTENAVMISIHQNYFSDGKYSGAQVFYAKSADSEALAKQLQQSLQQYLNPQNKRLCKSAEGIYLMEHVTCPAVLVECGFLSNPQEEALLRTPEYQKKLCAVIAVAIGRFLSNT